MNIGWPEGIYLTLIALKVILITTHDGEPKKGNHNGSATIVDAVIVLALLWWGGFFA